ncbi:hypothetical protein OY671_012112, partial [Metschnikowia pulcherrima]
AGLVEKSGAWFSYDSIRIGQGRENAKNYSRENKEVCDRSEAAIRGRTEQADGRGHLPLARVRPARPKNRHAPRQEPRTNMTDIGEWQGGVGRSWADEHARTDRSFSRMTPHSSAAIDEEPGR